MSRTRSRLDELARAAMGAAMGAATGAAMGATALAGLSMAGCAVTDSTNDSAIAAGVATTVYVTRHAGTAGHSREKRPIRYEVLGHGPETTLVVATIHGNEEAGTPLLRSLSAAMISEPSVLDGRTLVLVPVANPDGLALGRRTNARGIDLNRDFPASNARGEARGAGPAGPSRSMRDVEPETRALLNLILQFRPSRIVSIHQPLGCIDYDGPAEPLACAVAAAGDLPVRKLGARPGSLGSWAGVDRGVPVLTIELPNSASDLDAGALWERYGAMMMVAAGADGRRYAGAGH